MMLRLPRVVRLVPDPALLRGQEVLSITGDVSGLRRLGIEPASAEIGDALADVMDGALASARETANGGQA